MALRAMLLRVMLWSLGIAAVTGVLAVLTQGGVLAWRVVGTGFVTAAACGLMLPASRMIDREKSRSAGLLGMAAVVIEFVMATLLIWEIPRKVWGLSWEEQIAATMTFFGLAALTVMVLLQALRFAIAAVAARAGLYATLATFAAAEIAIWAPRRFYIHDDWWMTTKVIALFGALAAVTLIGYGTGDRRHWRWVGIAAGITAALMWLTDIWIGASSDLGTVIFSVLLSVAVVVAHAIATLSSPLPPHQGWVIRTAIGAAVLTAVFVDLLVIDDTLFRIGIDADMLGRFAAAAAIVTGCATLSIAVLARMKRGVDFERLSPELSEITVVCPRCRKKQAIGIGEASCSACRLRIAIQIEEPRCPQCEYLLFGLTSDRCPECGTLIAAVT